nr:MAG TPA_asm: hypothetical protein [Caudoviricetes sp.]
MISSSAACLAVSVFASTMHFLQAKKNPARGRAKGITRWCFRTQ